MRITQILQAGQRTPLIKFLGKRGPPSMHMSQSEIPAWILTTNTESVDHTPAPHPASPTHSLPDSFANYRSKAQQHGPLGSRSEPAPPRQSAITPSSRSMAYGAIGGHTGHSLGRVEAAEGQYFDRSELPKRFGRTPFTQAEIDAIDTAGASLWG